MPNQLLMLPDLVPVNAERTQTAVNRQLKPLPAPTRERGRAAGAESSICGADRRERYSRSPERQNVDAKFPTKELFLRGEAFSGASAGWAT